MQIDCELSKKLVKVFNDAQPGRVGIAEAIDEVIEAYESAKTTQEPEEKPRYLTPCYGCGKSHLSTEDCKPSTGQPVGATASVLDELVHIYEAAYNVARGMNLNLLPPAERQVVWHREALNAVWSASQPERESGTPTISAEALFKNICDFVGQWEGKVPARDSAKSLCIISDFYLCMGAEAKLHMIPCDEQERRGPREASKAAIDACHAEELEVALRQSITELEEAANIIDGRGLSAVASLFTSAAERNRALLAKIDKPTGQAV